ncbi:MAG: class I SAM-dependent methyltransferase [Promethearchaeota archaeon]
MIIGAIITLLPPLPAKLVDLGCGTGWISIFFAKRGYQVTGTDISEDMIYYTNQNRNKEKKDNLTFTASDFENMDFKNEYDCAVFYDALHHAEDEKAALRMTYKALKPSGFRIISEPGKGHSKRAKSIRTTEKYNVTEKDMPLSKIIKTGKEAGFKKFKVHPPPYPLNLALYANLDDDMRFLKGYLR